MAIDTTYQKQASESIDQYNSRIATYNSSQDQGGSSGTPGAQTAPNSDFLSQIQQKLLGQSDMVSSESTNLENKINEAIKSVQQGQSASAAAITSQYDRQIGVATQQGQNAMTSTMEQQRGFATNTAALRQLTTDTQNQLKDLEQRKQELILQGQASAAGQISNLQIQAIQFHQQAQQQVFSNLLQMGNFGQQQQQLTQSQHAQDFQEQSSMANTALQYGISVQKGDTLKDVIARAQPFASAKQKLDLAQVQSTIDRNRAESAKAYADAKSGAVVSDPASLDALARGSLNSNGAALALIKDPTTYANVVNRMASMQKEDVATAVTGYKSEGLNKAAAIRDARNTYSNNPQLLAIATSEIERQYGSDVSSTPGSGGGFVIPGSTSSFINAKPIPLPPASPDAVKALQHALLGTAFGK